jgi:hypothetical protein
VAEGWIQLHRRLADNTLWNVRPFSKGQAWVDILLMANWKDDKALIGGTIIECKRGQSIRSLDTWAKRWGWSKSAVRRFFVLLQSENMIVTESVQKTTRLTVCNYETYQEMRTDNEPIMNRYRNDDEPILAPREQGNNGTMKEENIGVPQADAPPPPPQKPKRQKRVIEMPEMPDSLKAIDGVPEAWEKWKQFRIESGKEIKPTTAEYQFRELLKSPNPLAMLEHSISKGYSGLYDPKPMNGQPKQPTYNKL